MAIRIITINSPNWYDKIKRWANLKFCRNSVFFHNSAEFCQILLNSAKFCWILLKKAEFQQNSAEFRGIWQNWAEFCSNSVQILFQFCCLRNAYEVSSCVHYFLCRRINLIVHHEITVRSRVPRRIKVPRRGRTRMNGGSHRRRKGIGGERRSALINRC